MADVGKQIEVLIRARYPILYLNSWEEQRVDAAVDAVAKRMGRTVHSWSVTQGMTPRMMGLEHTGQLPGELEVLAEIRESNEFTIFVLRDFHVYLKDSRVIRMLRDLAEQLRGKSQTILITSPVLVLPTELEKDVTVVDFPLPDIEEIGARIDEVLSKVPESAGIEKTIAPEDREVLVKAAQGLTLTEVESAIARSLIEKRRVDIQTIVDEKKQIVRKSGLLEYYPASNSFGDIGGHDLLKDWLEKRAKGFSDKAVAFGLPFPKGVLLLGVQGCGKSLIAKAIAATWRLPMLKLDVGRIFGSLVGQSEENIRKAIGTAESLAPCVLWADELEKGFAGVSGSGAGDSGTTARVFGTFLTWMQEKTTPVFLIATANDVSQLPPELLRKGRFDEIFFIDLPSETERQEIFSIHLSKRHREPASFDLAALSAATAGFSGAEIEQVVVGSLYAAFDADRDLQQDDLIHEAGAQVPLSRMMAEEIDELRTWAKLRARPSASR